MTNPKQEPKSAYNLIPVFIRGDREFINQLKSKAALAGIPLADFMRESIDYAIDNGVSTFFTSRGTDDNRNGNSQS